MCCIWTCLSTRACALLVHVSVCKEELCTAPRSVCLREPMMHLYVCFCAAPRGCLSSRAYNAAHVCFYLQELLCSFRVCLPSKALCPHLDLQSVRIIFFLCAGCICIYSILVLHSKYFLLYSRGFSFSDSTATVLLKSGLLRYDS